MGVAPSSTMAAEPAQTPTAARAHPAPQHGSLKGLEAVTGAPRWLLMPPDMGALALYLGAPRRYPMAADRDSSPRGRCDQSKREAGERRGGAG